MGAAGAALLLGFTSLGFVAVPVSAAPAPTPVMFIGDSLTELCTTTFNSYRDDVLAGLAAADRLVDAVGSRSTGTCYPSDNQHEGVAGDTTGGIAARIGAGLAATPEIPSVAFVLAGTNDAQENVPAESSAANLRSIVATLRAENPTIHIVIGQIPPYPGKPTETAALNAAIAGLAAGGASPVTVVDLHTGVVPGTHLHTDGIHLNAAGAQLLGSRIASALIATGRLARPTVLTFPPFVDEEAFVRQQYLDFMGRAADGPGLAFWLGVTNADRSNVASVIESFMRAPEFAPRRSVARLYRAYFGRSPDVGGFDFWTRRLAGGQGTLDDVSQFFATSPEFVATYGSLTDEAYVARVYANVLGRSPDQAGYDFWLRQMRGGMNRGQVMTRFSESPEYVGATRAKVDVDVVYRGMLGRTAEPAGFAFWQARVASDPVSLSTLIDNFFVSAEYAARVAT